MLKKFFVLFFAIVFFSKASFASSSRNITVFAEPSMAQALTKIARLYSQKNNVIVSINFNSALDLMNEVDSGEPADVFISAHSGLVEALRQKGVVDVYNVSFIARDEMVLVTSKDNPKILPVLLERKVPFEEAIKILDQNKSTLILDHQGNSSGKFGNDFISKFNFSDLKLLNKLVEDKTPIITIIKDNPEYYAILFASQIKSKSDLKILSKTKGQNIFYQALVIAGDNMEIAREFLKFLKTDKARKILVESGFAVD